MCEVKRYRWPELTAGEVFTGKEDAYNHRQEYVLATDYDQLRDQLQASQCAEQMATDDVKALREKLREARKALKMINAIYPQCWDLTNGDLAVMGKKNVDEFEEAHEAVSNAIESIDDFLKDAHRTLHNRR